MKGAWLIARQELVALFVTPLGYLITALALFLNALAFNAVAIGNGRRASTDVLQIFLLNAGFITEAAAVVLAMRLLAGDGRTGARSLLLTAPISDSSIVLGKYFGTLIFLALATLTSLYLPALIFVRGTVSLGHIAAGYIGLIAIAAATLSVSTFASALTNKPMVAVLIALGFMGALELCWYVGDIAEAPWRGWLKALSPVREHHRSFRQGLLQLSDVVFYLGLAYLGLFAAMLVVRQPESR